jgi:hypothetical protein
LLVLLISGCYYFNVVIYDNNQDLEEQDFEQQQVGEQATILDHIELLFSLPLHIHMH